MHVYVCDSCKQPVMEGGLRATKYGKRGLTIVPLEDISRELGDDEHYCGGGCLMKHYAWMALEVNAK